MNSIKILMALVAVCVLTVPAFSMPDRGIGQETCKCKQICDCAKPMMDDKCQEDNQNPCDFPEPMMGLEAGPIKVKVVKSMMGDRCKDGEQSPADFPMAEMGPEAGPHKAKIVKSMMGNRCQDGMPMMGPEAGPIKVKVVKSMMGDRCKDGEQSPADFPMAEVGPEAGPHKAKIVKSMMGDRCQDDMPMMGPEAGRDCPRPMKEDRC